MTRPTMNNVPILTVKILSILIGAGLLIQPADGAGWGSLKGRFVVVGTPPKMSPLNPTRDAYCVEQNPIDQAVVVGEDGGLANVVVYIRLGRRDTVDVHPDYAAALDEPAVLDNHGCEFVPHITLARAGQILVVKNTDPVAHNTNLKLHANGNVNPMVAAGSQFEKKLTKRESIPWPVDCNIHLFMHAYVLVQDHPYMAASAKDGTFAIKNIPAGEHEFQFWHEACGYLKNVKYQGGALSRPGRADLTITDGGTLDLGVIKVPASMLQ